MRKLRCPKCKLMYEFDGMPDKYCPSCTDREEKQFMAVHNFVATHPGADIVITSAATGVSQEKILRYLREERLSVSTKKMMYLLPSNTEK